MSSLQPQHDIVVVDSSACTVWARGPLEYRWILLLQVPLGTFGYSSWVILDTVGRLRIYFVTVVGYYWTPSDTLDYLCILVHSNAVWNIWIIRFLASKCRWIHSDTTILDTFFYRWKPLDTFGSLHACRS